MGEREFAEFLRNYGIEARRGQQYSGSADSPDVVHSLRGIHFEVKRTERTDLYGWLAQAERDAGDNIPIVVHRKNHQGWLAIIDANVLIGLLRRAGHG